MLLPVLKDYITKIENQNGENNVFLRVKYLFAQTELCVISYWKPATPYYQVIESFQP